MKIKTLIFSVVNNKISTVSIFATVVKKTSIHINAAIGTEFVFVIFYFATGCIIYGDSFRNFFKLPILQNGSFFQCLLFNISFKKIIVVISIIGGIVQLYSATVIDR